MFFTFAIKIALGRHEGLLEQGEPSGSHLIICMYEERLTKGDIARIVSGQDNIMQLLVLMLLSGSLIMFLVSRRNPYLYKQCLWPNYLQSLL